MIEIGSRVKDADQYKGTVRYIGPVASSKSKSEDDEWLGIEWDSSDRGKHDGSIVDSEGDLHRYFDCSMGSGSFVKAKKVTTGKSFTDALKERYVKMDAPLEAPESVFADAYVTTSKGIQKSIEFVGESKIRKWQQIDIVQKVMMRNDTVSYAGDEVLEVASHLIEVDLQDNLLHSWVEVAKLVAQMPLLQTLLLHGNKMQQMTIDIAVSLNKNCFATLKVLALNSCGVKSWSSIQQLQPFLHSLEELYLAGNCFCDLHIHTNTVISSDGTDSNDDKCNDVVHHTEGFASLRLLDISYCQLVNWTQIYAFSLLPSLQELLLDGNDFDHTIPSPNDAFQQLQRISLSSTKLNQWSDIDNLSSFQQLRQLRLSQIPLFVTKGASEVRPIIVSRLKHLNYFNGSIINNRERNDSEKMYLRSIMRDLHSDKIDVSNIDKIHPRYEELKVMYANDLLPVGGSTSGGGSLASDLVSVKLYNISYRDSAGTLEPVVKKLPLSLTISRLKQMIKQLFKVDTQVQELSIRPYKDSIATLLDDDEASLSYFGTIDDSEIFVNESG